MILNVRHLMDIFIAGPAPALCMHTSESPAAPTLVFLLRSSASPHSVMEPHAAPQATHSPAAACPSRPAPGLPCMVSAFRQEHCRLLRCRRSLPPCPVTGPCAAALGMVQETRNLTAFSTGPDKLKSSSGNHPSLASLGLDLSGSTGRPRSSGWWVSAQGPIGCNPD